VRYLFIPAVHPYLVSSCRTALGMSWKSGVAAEVIGIPKASIGEQLYYTKLYLDTSGLFAWTFSIILISAVFEFVFLTLLKKVRH
jgi:NitT/TauT family transport system permease protein